MASRGEARKDARSIRGEPACSGSGSAIDRAMIKTLLCFLLIVSAGAHAADAKTTFTNPTDAGPDFAVQGEYLGPGVAAQVIAKGDGTFHIVGFAGNLPGAGESEKKREADGKWDGDKVVFSSEGITGQIQGNELTATDIGGNKFVLNKTERKSPTLGVKPPEGATVLFDGTNADAWSGGKLDAEGNLQAGTLSKREFGDCQLHVEFRTPFMPNARGQARGNSGVYLQNRHEVQVLDSFGLSGENNECGGIYSKHRPKVNMCFPPLSWQTYDIDYTAARYDAAGKKTSNAKLTVRHNGVLIHENAEVDSATTASGLKDGPGTGPIQLQNHGNPVAYRNIWIVEKK
jgi:hypothetical protein